MFNPFRGSALFKLNCCVALLAALLAAQATFAATVGTTDAKAVCGDEPLRPAEGAGRPSIPDEDDITEFDVASGRRTVEIGTGVKLPNPIELYGITAIGIRERNNRPCEVQLFGGLLDPAFGPDERLVAEVTLDRCGMGAGKIDYKSVSFAERKNRFVRGVRGCGEKSSFFFPIEELKGLEIYPGEVLANGQLVPHDVTAKFERANCKVWDKPILCPCNGVVVGLLMHHRADQFTGFEVLCKSIKAMPGLEKGPAKDKTGF